MEPDYTPFDHGTQTKQKGDKFYHEDLLSDSEKFGDSTELKDEDNIPY